MRLGIEGFVNDTWQAQKKVIEQDYNREKETRTGREYPRIEWLPRLRNKFDRIDVLQPLIRNQWLGFKQGLDNAFMKQMTLYPTGDFVDAPDALEGACQLRISKFEIERRKQAEISRQRRENYRVTI